MRNVLKSQIWALRTSFETPSALGVNLSPNQFVDQLFHRSSNQHVGQLLINFVELNQQS